MGIPLNAQPHLSLVHSDWTAKTNKDEKTACYGKSRHKQGRQLPTSAQAVMPWLARQRCQPYRAQPWGGPFG